MKHVIIIVMLALASPAWGEEPCDRLEQLEIWISAASFRAGTVPGAAQLEQANIAMMMEEYKIVLEKCEESKNQPQVMTIEVPDMNGDGQVDGQDKRLAEYAVEEYRRAMEIVRDKKEALYIIDMPDPMLQFAPTWMWNNLKPKTD